MCRKLCVVLAFVLVTCGSAAASFDTVGVYDPTDEPYNNDIEQSAVFKEGMDSAYVIDLQSFRDLLARAYPMDAGGVVNAEPPGQLEPDGSIVAKYGQNLSKSLQLLPPGGKTYDTGGTGSGERQPISGNTRFSYVDQHPVINIGELSGEPGEVVTAFAMTVVDRDRSQCTPGGCETIATATFSGGGTVTSAAIMFDGTVSNDQDTFFGFVAPLGQSITGVEITMPQWSHYDDFAFITSALKSDVPAGVTIPVEAGGDIAAANAAAVAGDTIDIAAGTFAITAAIEIKDGVTYQGAGADLTVIDGGNLTRAFVAWGDRGATNGQVDANGVGVPNATGPTGWVLDGLTIQNCVSDTENRQDILSAARDLLNSYTGAPYTLTTAQEENGGITDNPGWFDILSGSADDNLTDAELQAYLDANPVGSAGHLVVNDDKSDDGGAVCILNGADGTIRNCTFSNNTADGHGGAINVDGDALVVAIEDCAFDLNTSGGDAAVNLTGDDSNFTVTGCSFTECTAGDDAGALSMESGERTIYTVTDCTFTGNYCADDGGAIKADGDDSTNVWTNCTFIGNTAGDDGAAVRYSPDRAELTMTNCAFIGNGKDADGTVVGDDGVWQCKDDDAGPITFMNCLFADNACNDDRFIELKAAFALINCTFIGNVGGDKALIAVRGRAWDSTGDGVKDATTDDSIISNCLFINNTMLSDSNVIGDTRDNIFAPTVTNCLFFGNLDGSNPANNTNNDSTEVGTIDVSAVTDAAQIVVDPAGDYHLAASSPAIDASDPATATATDIEGTAAVGVRDVGAYEYSAN